MPIVAAGVALARERTRPGHLRAIGLAFGAGATVLFASRDNLVRWLATQGSARPAVAAAATSLWGVALTALLVRHEGIGRRIVAGAALVVAGGALIGAFR